MDTAAAAAAAVVVDLRAETELSKSSASKLLNKPKPKPSAASYGAGVGVGVGVGIASSLSSDLDISNCLGSTVESMSATPPTTPARCRNESGDTTGNIEALAHGIAMNGIKEAVGEREKESCHQESSPLNSTTSTSSTNASTTTPTSALLTAPTTATPTLTSTPTATGTSTSTATALAITSTIATATQNTTATVAATATMLTTSSSSKTTSIARQDNIDQLQLLHWQDMPKYLQFNPYVLKGYRPLQTFKGCLLSLFYWHNETINILTHAIPIFYILAIVPGLMPWDSGYKFLSFCHVFGSVAPWCGSFVYHLFMNIEKGENVYYTLLKLDMVGIWVSQSFGALPLVTATTLCFNPFLKWLIIVSYCLLSLWGLYKALTASSPWQRRLCFALPFAMRSVLTFLRIRGMVGGSHMALSHVYLQDGVSILGGAIGAMRIPEKWFPGLVDFYLNSHNIMHVLVVVAVYSMHKATIKDFEWMSTQTCNSLANATEESLVHLEL
ncbi:progestin and adipoQ receptor family member 4 isoform X1 [Drosophila nasuta]|uniref:progestin and adipoQ receptor family member 4 isoform X1 n=1 Tax=Drosophila nasuta TaxID=42062 RepID=UPI00295F536C|nr:progestin and adipoQ receptor family member 4 isoform X1 [Drosophila nasuta]